MKKIIKQIRYLIAISLGFIVFIIFLFLRLFKNIRFGIIYSNRVGHLCHNVDAYLSIKKKNEMGIFGTTNKISNRFIFNNWKNNKNIYFNKVGFYGYFFLKEFIPKSKLLIKWTELYPNYSKIMLSKRNFKLEHLNKQKSHLLKELEIKSSYICFHNRDEAYLNHTKGDGNEHKFRNYNFIDYKSSIKFLNSKNIETIRIGKKVEKKINPKIFKNMKFKEITNKKRTDFIDVFLINNCEFLVASATGVSNIASILRKKIILVNTIPFWLREMYQYTKGSIFLPKKIYSIKKKKDA